MNDPILQLRKLWPTEVKFSRITELLSLEVGISNLAILILSSKSLDLCLGLGFPLEKEMATDSSNLAWRIPWTEEPGGLQSIVSQRVKHDWAAITGFPRWCSGKQSACQCKRYGLGRSPGAGHGNPLQYSYLENPMDREAWWSIVHRVTESDMTEMT